MKPIVKKALASVAVVGALASVVTGRENPAPAVVEPVKRVDTRLQVNADIDLSRLEERTHLANKQGAWVDAFAPRNFSPIVPPEAQAKAPEQRPEAPALPFRYLGKLVEDGKTSIFLANGDESITVAPGMRIGDYRVDRITEAEVRFTYLPMKKQQSLPL
ncbi:MAG TPA: hypothetical protein VFK84_03145 [Burkholderiales bacterium]|nr:hypothetical protein [Burkholderiales bacterium]